MDDIFTIVHEIKTKEILDVLNKAHRNLKFMVRTEHGEKWILLDITVYPPRYKVRFWRAQVTPAEIKMAPSFVMIYKLVKCSSVYEDAKGKKEH